MPAKISSMHLFVIYAKEFLNSLHTTVVFSELFARASSALWLTLTGEGYNNSKWAFLWVILTFLGMVGLE